MTDWLLIERDEAGQVPLVLIPGWGFTAEVLRDHPLFANMSLIMPTGLTSAVMIQGLNDFLLSEKIDQVRLLGWSMGGNVALDFARKFPHTVTELILVAVRRCWSAEAIAFTREGLLDPTGVGMEKFYRKCFLGAKADYKKFASTMLAGLLEQRNVAFLEQGLDYLASYQMVESLAVPVHIIQGEKDMVCPITEMVCFPEAKSTVLKGAGHFPFSHPDFSL